MAYTFTLESVGFQSLPAPKDGGDFGGGDFGEATDVNVNSAQGLTNAAAPPAAPKATNSAFTTGLNLLFSDPTAFFNTLTSNDASSVPNAEVQKAANKPISENLPTLNPWIKVGIVIVGLAVVGFILYEVKK